MVIFFACYAYQFFYIPVALLKKKKQPSSEGTPHRFAVLIAARNEEAVIGNLIDRQEAPVRADVSAVYADLSARHGRCTRVQIGLEAHRAQEKRLGTGSVKSKTGLRSVSQTGL